MFINSQVGPHATFELKGRPRVPVLEDTSEESALLSLVESWRASIRWAGPVERHFLLLAPFGCPEPFVHVEGAKLRRASCEKDKTSVRAATVNSSKESSHHLWWAPERVNPLVDASASHLVLWEVNCVFFCGSNVRTSSFASSVECVAKNARWPSRKEIRVCLFLNTSLGEVHEVMTLASDAPGSLFGQLEKITRDSGHHS